MEWYIRGSEKLSEWQRTDMNNECNCAFSDNSNFYYTDNPKYLTWNFVESRDEKHELFETHKEISFDEFMNIWRKIPIKPLDPESDIPLKLLLKKLKIK